MASISQIFIPLIFFWIIAIAILTLITKTTKQKTQPTTTTTTIYQQPQQLKHTHQSTRYQQPQQQQYSPQFSPQMEIDLRLPYRRFKQLYPHNTLTYEEYKKIQVQNAFKRSLSSQKNHRMVR